MSTHAPFEDRRDGGRRLSQLLSHHAGRQDVLVLGLPRGGVPVGFEVASALSASLDVFLVRKADEIACACTPDPFGAVGAWYHDFTPTSDAEVRELLELAAARTSGQPTG